MGKSRILTDRRAAFSGAVGERGWGLIQPLWPSFVRTDRGSPSHDAIEIDRGRSYRLSSLIRNFSVCFSAFAQTSQNENLHSHGLRNASPTAAAHALTSIGRSRAT